MNRIKYSAPDGTQVVVRVSQCPRAINGTWSADGKKLHPRQSLSKALADRIMYRKGYKRAGAKS